VIFPLPARVGQDSEQARAACCPGRPGPDGPSSAPGSSRQRLRSSRLRQAPCGGTTPFPGLAP